jgi:hypothetical protein
MLFAIWLVSSIDALGAEPVILRTAVTPDEAWVGQKIILHVDVLAIDGWAQLRKVDDIEVSGAYLLRLETQGTRLNETIGDNRYTGQRYEFMLFAQRDGKLTIPPVPVDIEIKTWGAGGGSRIERMILPVVELIARMPPGAEDLQWLTSTSDFQADQDWSGETDHPKVGDAIERTISLRASDVPGMAFAPMRYNRIENLGVYPGEPTVEDKYARGDLTGTRLETVTYVFERAGNFEIPDVTFSWWDVAAGQLKHVVLPGLSVQVTGKASAESVPSETTARQKYTGLLWSTLLAVLLAAIVAFRFGGRGASRWKARRRARREAEARYFRRAIRSVRSGDRKAALRDTMRWLDRINTDTKPARLDQFLGQYGNSEAPEAAIDWENLKSAELARNLKVARKRWRQAQRGTVRSSELLPELNS